MYLMRLWWKSTQLFSSYHEHKVFQTDRQTNAVDDNSPMTTALKHCLFPSVLQHTVSKLFLQARYTNILISSKYQFKCTSALKTRGESSSCRSGSAVIILNSASITSCKNCNKQPTLGILWNPDVTSDQQPSHGTTVCKGDRPCRWKTVIFRLPGNEHPSIDRNQIWHGWLHRGCHPTCKIWYPSPYQGGYICVKLWTPRVYLFTTVILYLLAHLHRSHRLTDFHG